MQRAPLSLVLKIALTATLCAGRALGTEDCNANGVADDLDIAPTPVFSAADLASSDYAISLTAVALDRNGNRVPFDADGDGATDLAIVNHVPGGVTVHLNDGSGNLLFDAFIPLNDWAAGLRIEAADIDADDDPDLIVATDRWGVDGIVILTNDGAGNFTIGAGIVATGAWAIAVGDIDGDSDLDLVARDTDPVTFTPRLSLLLNNGTGAFAPGATIALAAPANSVAIADFDGDGDLDLAVDANQQIRVLLNSGSGAFPFAGDFSVAPYSLHSVSAIDVDGDGLPDLAGAAGGSGIRILRNQGGAVFGTPEEYFPASAAQWLSAADLDADGDEDLLAAGGSVAWQPQVTLLRNTGDGTFAGPIYLETGGFDISPALTTGDFDGDGAVDLAAKYVAGGSWPEPHIVWNDPLPPASPDCDGNGVPDACDLAHRVTFAPRVAFGTGVEPVWVQATAVAANRATLPLDLNSDGLVDLATANENGDAFSVLLNAGFDGMGRWLGFSLRDVPTDAAMPVSLAAGDFDRDGDIDVAAGGIGNGQIAVHFNDGAGQFPAADLYEAAGVWIAAADFNDDGWLDLASSTHVLINKADGTGDFDPPTAIDSGGNTPWGMDAADLDADGDIDLAIANLNDGTVGIVLNAGDGTFGPPATYPVGEPWHLAIAELNGDGWPDLAVGNNGNAEGFPGLAVLLNDGDGTFADAVTYFVAPVGPPSFSLPYARFATPADLDADGDTDLVVSDRFGPRAVVLLNTGDATFVPALPFETGQATGRIVACDVNADNSLDLVSADQFDDTVSVLLFAGVIAAASEDCNANAVPDGCDVADGTSQDNNGNGVPDECEGPLCPGDLDGDGDVDLADLAVLLAHYGTTGGAQYEDGDLDGDADVDLADLSGLLAVYGTTCP